MNFSFLERENTFLLDEKITPKKDDINSYEIEEGTLVISVSDSGIGITQENIPKLFKQFSQVSEGTKKKQGTGLGLYIVKLLCVLMGGDIKVHSMKGKGTTFTIYVPVYS